MDEQLSKQLGLRIVASDFKRLKKLNDIASTMSLHSIARTALLIGLRAIEENPNLLLNPSLFKGEKK